MTQTRYHRTGTGMVLGKFMPPHRGHVFLIEFARQYVHDLTVVVESVAGEPIPIEIRHRWMQELFPDCRVVRLDDRNPQDPSQHPEFWHIWRNSLLRILPHPPDYVFASEAYGPRLAEILGATFIPVDPGRKVMAISGTAVRAQPLAHWHYLPECVKPYFAKRVCVFGPESTGKSTLARQLAESFHTVFVPEHARAYLETRQRDIQSHDIEFIARGQLAAEDALARQANKLLICDTDILATTIWSDVLFGHCPPWIREAAHSRHYDLTLLLDIDVPWIADPVRYLPEQRRSFFHQCQAALEAHGRRYVIVRGTWEQRWHTAREAVAALLTEPANPSAP